MATNEERIKATARSVIDALATPINGVPSVVVKNRANAERLVAAAFDEVWRAVSQSREDDEEPIEMSKKSMAWVKAGGFVPDPEAPSWAVVLPGPWKIRLTFAGDTVLRLDEREVKANPVRGDVRRLAACLGVELREG